MKNQKGITLIALVITIIVLLILAGVSIAMLTGENGILNQATTSKYDTKKAEMVERANMELNAAYAKILAGETIDDDDVTAATNNIGTELNTYYTITVAKGTGDANELTITAIAKDTNYNLATETGTASSTGVTVLVK